jgi:hypothetical protein
MQEPDRVGRSDQPDRIVLQTDQARGGVTGHNVRYMLAFGLLGAVAACFLAGFLAGVIW